MSQAGKPAKVLTLEKFTAPALPLEKWVKVKVHAAALSYLDVLACFHPKRVLAGARTVVGHEFSGEVLSSGSSQWSAGTQVVGWCPGGAQAAEVWVHESQLKTLPSGYDALSGAALPITYVAAWQMLVRILALQKTQRLLIVGGSGALGTALITLGRAMGLEMYVTADARYHKDLHLIGASPINYQAEDYLRAVKRLSIDGAHAVIDLVGNSLGKSWDCLRPQGHLISAGNMSKEKSGGLGVGFLDKLELGLQKIGSGGKQFTEYKPLAEEHMQSWSTDFDAVVAFMHKHNLKPYLAPIIKQDAALQALVSMHEQKSPLGKVVVDWR